MVSCESFEKLETLRKMDKARLRELEELNDNAKGELQGAQRLGQNGLDENLRVQLVASSTKSLSYVSYVSHV